MWAEMHPAGETYRRSLVPIGTLHCLFGFKMLYRVSRQGLESNPADP